VKHASITELAESDISKMWLYIARDSPEAADRFIDKLRVQCDRLASSPSLGRPRPDFAPGLCSYRVGNYFIFYFPSDAGIEVARVLHSARDLPRLF